MPQVTDAAGNYSASFGGTSSACPGAAAVTALVLSRNPELRRKEVVDILRQACDHIDPTDGRWGADWHSPWYGYGRFNAATAVQLAAPRRVDRLVVERAFAEPVQDLTSARVTLDVREARELAELTVRVDIEHSHVGRLLGPRVDRAARHRSGPGRPPLSCRTPRCRSRA